MQAQKAVGQDAAFEERVEPVLDELRQSGAGCRLGLLEAGGGALVSSKRCNGWRRRWEAARGQWRAGCSSRHRRRRLGQHSARGQRQRARRAARARHGHQPPGRLQHLKHCPGLHARHCSARAAAPAAPAATALGDSGRRFVATGLRRSAGFCRLPPINSALKPAMHLDPLPCRPHHPASRLPAPDAPASLRGPLVVALLATLSALALVLAPGPASGGAALAQLPQQQVGGWRPSGLLQTQQTPGHQRPQCPA